MISLFDAFKLMDIKSDEVVSIRPYPVDGHSGRIITTKEKIEKVPEFESINVHKIGPWFSCGDYEGIEFAVSGYEIMNNVTSVL